VEQAVTGESGHRADTPAEIEQFDKVAQTGWKWFTRFLLWNVLACAAILLLIGVFTVWS